MTVSRMHTIVGAGLGAMLLGNASQAGTLTTLYTFAGGADGYGPTGALAYAGGVFYGTTHLGGPANRGTVFKYDPATGKKTTLYAFTGGADGGEPVAGVIYVNNVLYGTAEAGASTNCGTVFKIDLATGIETTLHAFQSEPDGCQSSAPLLYLNGTLYGTTGVGGQGSGQTGLGTIFKVDAGTGAETVLWQFGSMFPNGDRDGWNPNGGLTNINGVLYGTTGGGSLYGGGNIFQLNTATNTYSELLAFCDSHGCASGKNPYSTLTYANGLLYGTTSGGGVVTCYQKNPGVGCGTLFAFDPATNALTILYDFVSADGLSYNDITFQSNAIYASTYEGGKQGQGELFKFALKADRKSSLYSFKAKGDGYNPNSLIYIGGAFNGTTQGGGCAGGSCAGTIFEVIP